MAKDKEADEAADWMEPEFSPEGAAYQPRSGPDHTTDSGTRQAEAPADEAEQVEAQAKPSKR